MIILSHIREENCLLDILNNRSLKVQRLNIKIGLDYLQNRKDKYMNVLKVFNLSNGKWGG